MTYQTCQLLIIGAGPGGYIAAIRAGQLGLDTVIVDAGPLGGTCLNIGCIPSKALIHAADEFYHVKQAETRSALGIQCRDAEIDFTQTMSWKDAIVKRLTSGVGGLLKKAKTQTISGHASFVDGKTVKITNESGESLYRADHIIIATGSKPTELPGLPFGGRVISSTEALSLREIPQSMAIIGAGYIGLELGMAYAKLGCQVTLLEAAHEILPGYDSALTKPVLNRLESLGIGLHLKARVTGLSEEGQALDYQTEDKATHQITTDKILVTVGRKPLMTGWGLEELALDRDGPFLKIDHKCQTSMRGIYAIGDITRGPMLAHRAMAQGEMVAEIIAGQPRFWDKRAIPAVCFTDPEIVSVGLSPGEAAASGHEIKTELFPFAANGRALSMQAETGFIRLIARADTHVILGIQAVGTGISELSASFSLALEMGARLEDIAGTIHAHPTQSEAFQEAALRTLGHALHI